MNEYEAASVDMVVVTIADPQVCSSIEGLSAGVHQFIRLLDWHVNGQGSEQRLLRPSWRLWVAGVPLFPFAFAPFYPEDHPRFSPTGVVHLVLQLEDSFTRHGITSSLPERRRLSAFVQACFERQQVAYLPAITRLPAKSLRLVKPLALGMDPVLWWTFGAKATRAP